jgi:hypothetical protein
LDGCGPGSHDDQFPDSHQENDHGIETSVECGTAVHSGGHDMGGLGTECGSALLPAALPSQQVLQHRLRLFELQRVHIHKRHGGAAAGPE